MEFMSAKDASKKWGISQRRVAILCSENRVPNAEMIGNAWVIPIDANKPVDARVEKNTTADIDMAKPFLKWAGGKGQLLKEIEKYYPFENDKYTKYCEPFIGGGAVLFDILNKYELKEIYISDINPQLVNTYTIVRNNVKSLIDLLSNLQNDYVPLDNDKRKIYYNNKRERYNFLIKNSDESNALERASLMIFLNKTCFNGLYRVNRSGLFNVPMGAYKNPLICDRYNLINVSEKLKNVRIVCGDYKNSLNFIDGNTFVYFDPPYRPLSQTSSFTSYTEDMFNDEKQIELANFIDLVNAKKAKILISNSDPKNLDVSDNFFDNLYSKYIIDRVDASRSISCQASNRGNIKELLITNELRGTDMEKRNFENWLSTFRDSIANYKYYVNFEKVHKNVESIKVELNILNSLIGSKNIESEFINIVTKYPETLKCIPILLAVRASEIYAIDKDGAYKYNFINPNISVNEYKMFMHKTGLFDLMQNHIISNLIDYVTGVETGLDSNGRKNRGGHLMEDLVEDFIRKSGFEKDKTYFKEMYIHQITEKWNIDLSAISNDGKMEKRFDYVIKTDNMIYAIETNFYGSGGSKLNETARSYKTLALESETIDGFTFVWFTDGHGWNSAKHNLEETFDVMDNIYNITDMEKGIMNEVFK